MTKALKKEKIIGLLKKHKQQVTASRLAICEYVLSPYMHTTAEDVKQYLAKNFPNISLATVYNTLNMLVEVGELREIHVPNSKKVIFDSTKLKHYHVYDEIEDKVYDIDASCVKVDLSCLGRFELEDVDIVLRGRVVN